MKIAPHFELSAIPLSNFSADSCFASFAWDFYVTPCYDLSCGQGIKWRFRLLCRIFLKIKKVGREPQRERFRKELIQQSRQELRPQKSVHVRRPPQHSTARPRCTPVSYGRLYQKIASATRTTVIIHSRIFFLGFFSSAMPRSTPQLTLIFKYYRKFRLISCNESPTPTIRF